MPWALALGILFALGLGVFVEVARAAAAWVRAVRDDVGGDNWL